MKEDFLYREAKKRVKKKKDFYGHLIVFLVVNTIFFFIVFLNNGGFAWLIPASFWSMGLAINYFSVFGLPGSKRVGGTDWEANELRKEIEKMGGTISDIPSEELELREIQRQKQGWDESDLV